MKFIHITTCSEQGEDEGAALVRVEDIWFAAHGEDDRPGVTRLVIKPPQGLHGDSPSYLARLTPAEIHEKIKTETAVRPPYPPGIGALR